MAKRRRIPYSEAEMQWLLDNYKMVISDYHKAFVEKFGRDDVTLAHLNALRKRQGWKVGRDGSRYKGRHKLYSQDEIEWLKANVTLPTAQWHGVFCEKFNRTDISAQQLIGLRKNRRWRTGRNGRFEKGQRPANKGKKMPYNANSAATQFKKGQVPPNAQPLWSERICPKDGYVLMKVPRKNPWNGQKTMFMHKHRYLWEEANGPIPEGMALKCLDGDKTNCALENWELVDRAILPRLNSRWGRNFESAPAEVKPAMLGMAKVEQKLCDLSRAKSKKGGSHDHAA